MKNFDDFDRLNTTAVHWLKIYSKEKGKPLGLKNFDINNPQHKWFLKNVDIASILNGYQNYYIDCDWFTWFKLRYFKHYNYMYRVKNAKEEIEFIDLPIFVSEVCAACEKEPSIIDEMFKEYWRV